MKTTSVVSFAQNMIKNLERDDNSFSINSDRGQEY